MASSSALHRGREIHIDPLVSTNLSIPRNTNLLTHIHTYSVPMTMTMSRQARSHSAEQLGNQYHHHRCCLPSQAGLKPERLSASTSGSSVAGSSRRRHIADSRQLVGSSACHRLRSTRMRTQIICYPCQCCCLARAAAQAAARTRARGMI
jgi:hypothetical protein